MAASSRAQESEAACVPIQSQVEADEGAIPRPKRGRYLWFGFSKDMGERTDSLPASAMDKSTINCPFHVLRGGAGMQRRWKLPSGKTPPIM